MRKALRQETDRKKKNNNKLNFEIKLDRKKLSILAACLVVVIAVVVINNYIALGLVLNKNIDSDDVIQVELQTSNNKIIPYGNEILVYNKGNITCYNNYGKNTWEITLEDTVDAEVKTAGKYIQVINKDKGLVYVYKNKYEVARIKIDGQIYSGNINRDGTSVIEYSASGNKTQLGIYSNSGEMKYNVKLNNKIIGKYVLSDNSKYLAYIDVNVYGISAYTNVNLIGLSNIKDDDQNARTIYSSENSLAYDIYWDSKNVITRFDDKYVIYDTFLNKLKTVEISEGQVVNIGDYNKKYAYTLIDTNGNYMLAIRSMTSDRIKTVQIEDTPKYFKYENGVVYVCYGKKIEAYNNLGMKIKNYDSSMVITEPVIFNSGASLAMSISNKLIIFTI